MAKTTDDNLIGLLVIDLLEGHWQACDNAGTDAEPMPSIMQEDYEGDDIETIENVGGDNAHIRLTTASGKAFRITVREE